MPLFEGRMILKIDITAWTSFKTRDGIMSSERIFLYLHMGRHLVYISQTTYFFFRIKLGKFLIMI